MDPVTLIVTALDAAGTAVRDAYQGLKRLVRARLAGRTPAQAALAEHETDPQTWPAPLARELERADAAADADLLEQARRLLELVEQSRPSIDLRGAQGDQVGDHNQQRNRFG
jgi:hypothetical protein